MAEPVDGMAGRDDSDLLRRLLRSHPTQDSYQAVEINRTSEISALITHAVRDQNPSYTLGDIIHALVTSNATSDLDALHVVSLLIHCGDPAAKEILDLLAACGNAKEVVISAQEWFEKLHHDILSEEGLEESRIILALERLLHLYIGAIPRLKLRKRTASATLDPLFADIVPVIEAAGPSLNNINGRAVIHLICNLLTITISWASKQDDEVDLPLVQKLCRNTLGVILAELSTSLPANFAQLKFEQCNPRLINRWPASTPTESDTLVQECYDTALALSSSVESLLQERTTGSLILLSLSLSRSTSPSPSPNALLTSTFPVITASLQSNICVDASLHVLLHALYPSNRQASVSVDPDLVAPLCTALVPVASTSPEPQTRLIAFRILGALLDRAPPLERMGLLRDLLIKSPFPAMRVAAVGLLKNTVLEALAAAENAGTDPFASPAMLQTFGYIVLRPDPSDVFQRPSDLTSLESFVETQEPRRLVECLGFYYVLLLRDEKNFTGVRESNQLVSVERGFLTPLRNALCMWSGLKDLETEDEHVGMALAALETSLQRIEEAYEKLNLSLSYLRALAV